MKKTQISDIDFIASVAHQAVNPLNGVIGNLGRIIAGDVDKNMEHQRLKSAKGQLMYAVALLRNMAYLAEVLREEKDWSKEATKQSIVPQELINAAQFYIDRSVENEKRISIKDREIQNCVHGDPLLLRQVFTNIFDNFIKYSLEHQSVSVEHRLTDSKNVCIQFSSKTIPIANVDKIFKLRYRDKHAEEITSAGTGIGLFLCREILHKVFQGTIFATHDKKSQETCFTITIPNGYALPTRRDLKR